MIRIAISGDGDLFRSGLRAILESRRHFSVVAEGTAEQALELTRTTRPDILLACLTSTQDSILFLDRFKRVLPPPPTLVLAEHMDERDARRLLHRGASGLLLKNTARDHLHWAILAVSRGVCALSPEISKSVIREYIEPDVHATKKRSAQRQILHLTPRERDILTLISDGLSNREVAGILEISPETVKDHVRSVCAKLDVKNRLQAARVAWQCEDTLSHSRTFRRLVPTA